MWRVHNPYSGAPQLKYLRVNKLQKHGSHASSKKRSSGEWSTLAPGTELLVSVSTGVVCHLAAHVVARHLYFEERAVCTHAELVPYPVTAPRLVPAGGTGQARWADHHGSVEDDAVFL